jgi:hypothetical protein
MMRSFLLVTLTFLITQGATAETYTSDAAASYCRESRWNVFPERRDGPCVTEEAFITCMRLVTEEACTNVVWMVDSCPLLVTCGAYAANPDNLRSSTSSSGTYDPNDPNTRAWDITRELRIYTSLVSDHTHGEKSYAGVDFLAI